MSLSYKKYKIQPGETLEAIARKCHLTVEALRAFHNQYCELYHLIGGSKIPKGCKEIFIPVETARSPQPLNAEGYIKAPSSELRRSQIKINKTYGVIHKVMENEQQKSQIHYQIKIGNEVGEDLPYNQIYVRKYQTFLNEQELEMNVDQLYQKLDQLLYPLQLSLHKDGTINSIVNKQEISNRWFKDKRSEFMQYYVGELSEKIFAALDNFFKNIGQYEDQITNSLFYTLFFMPLYVNYNEDNEYAYKREIPVFPFKKKVEYSITQKMDKKISPTGKIFIRLTGECTDSRSGHEMETGKAVSKNRVSKEQENKKGEFRFIYKLDSKDKTLFSAVGEVSVISSPEKKSTVKMEIYELV